MPQKQAIDFTFTFTTEDEPEAKRTIRIICEGGERLSSAEARAESKLLDKVPGAHICWMEWETAPTVRSCARCGGRMQDGQISCFECTEDEPRGY